MARADRDTRASRRTSRAPRGAVGRARLLLLGAVVLSAVVLFAWFPAGSLLSQRSTLTSTQSQLTTLHQQDIALAQEKKNLSDSGEIGRIARQQYQLVNPGQQAYEVLPPSGAATPRTPYAGDPGSTGPVAPSATPELPPGGVTTTTTPSASSATGHGGRSTQPSEGTGFVGRMLHSLEFWR